VLTAAKNKVTRIGGYVRLDTAAEAASSTTDKARSAVVDEGAVVAHDKWQGQGQGQGQRQGQVNRQHQRLSTVDIDDDGEVKE
jgi:hypothetical protein